MAARLQTSVGNQAVLRQKAPEPAKPKFRALEDDEFRKRVGAYEAKGKKRDEAMFLALDDMFDVRVTETGGKRLPNTATPGNAGKPALLAIAAPIIYEGKALRPGIFEAGVDDQVYNCHSFTFLDARSSKLSILEGMIKTVPAKADPDGPPPGTKFFLASDLVSSGIHFKMERISQIYPRWVLDDEARALLKQYRPLKPGEKAARGDIAIYSTKGDDLPHSGKVIDVDAKGTPTRIKSKWGEHSLFEHAPDAVQPDYGKPTFWRKVGPAGIDAGEPKREPQDRTGAGSLKQKESGSQ